MTSTQIWITGGVAFYMLAMLAIGFWANQRIKDTKDYIIAGGKLGWWLAIGTLFATWFGAETCMGSSAMAFQKGILGVITDPFGAGLCLILSGLFFARFFRTSGIVTIADFFESRYSKNTAWLLSLLYIPVYIGWIGAQLLAFGFILNSLTGLPLMPSVAVSTAVVVIYTYSGGMWADAMTDLFQCFILVIGLIVVFAYLFKDTVAASSANSAIPKDFFYFYPRNASAFTWFDYLESWMIVGLGSLPAQDLIQRTMASKNSNVAKWGSIAAGCLYIGLGLIPVLLGIFGRGLFPETTGESILIDLALRYLPAPLIALLIGALLSAIMSSADSALLAPASIIGHNIVSYLKPDASDKLKLFVCKISVPLLGLLSLCLALYFKNIYRLCQEAWTVLLVGVVAAMIAGVYWKRATSTAAMASALFGTSSWILLKLFAPEIYPERLIGFAISAVTLIAVTLLTSKNA